MIIQRQIFGAHFVYFLFSSSVPSVACNLRTPQWSILLSLWMTPLTQESFGWIECSESDFSNDLFADEVESELQTSDEKELPFARHGPVLKADPEELSNQRDFWISCAIGIILDYR